MEGEEKLTFRLSSEDLALIEEMVLRHEYPSEAEAVREAVRAFIDGRFTDSEKADVLDKAARRRMLSLNEFTADGTDGEEILRNVITGGSAQEERNNE